MVIVGIMAQLETSDSLELPLSVDSCLCPTNATSYTPEPANHDFSLARISYMWYPFMGCMLTVLFSLIVSYLDSTIKYRNVVKINNRTTVTLQPTSIKEPKAQGVDNIAYNNDKY